MTIPEEVLKLYDFMDDNGITVDWYPISNTEFGYTIHSENTPDVKISGVFYSGAGYIEGSAEIFDCIVSGATSYINTDSLLDFIWSYCYLTDEHCTNSSIKDTLTILQKIPQEDYSEYGYSDVLDYAYDLGYFSYRYPSDTKPKISEIINKARTAWLGCKEAYEKLQQMLPADVFEKLLYEIERL